MILRLRRRSQFAAVAVVTLGSIVVIGWATGQPLLTTLLPGLPSTSLATALMFLASAVSLWLQGRPAGSPHEQPAIVAAKIIAAIVALASTHLLLGYAFNPAEAGRPFGPHYGRVASGTATCFLLASLGLLALGQRVLGSAMQAFAGIGLVLCALALTTYTYKADALAQVAFFSTMALPTTLLFTILFIAILLAQPFPGWFGYIVSLSSGGHMARRLLPAILLVPFVLGWLLVAAEGRDYVEPAFGFATMVVAVVTILTIGVCMVSASMARGDLDLRRINDTLRDSEHNARAITDTAMDAFIQTDNDGRIVEWNRKAEAIFGWSHSDVIGQQIEDLVMTPALREEALQARAQFRSTGETTFTGRRLEREMVARDGTIIPAELSCTAIPQHGGLMFNFFIRDLSQANALEAQLRHAQKMEAVGTLTGGMAHDFNNILGIVIGNLDLLEDRIKDDPDGKAMLDDAIAAALSGSELTKRLLAFARRQPLAPRIIDANALIEGIAPLLRRTLGEIIAISVNLGTGVWPIKVDPAQLESAILNLCTNARDAMPHGGTLTISTHNGQLDEDYTRGYSELAPGDYVVIEVSDTGTGISKKHLDQIFEPFFTTKEPGKGTGLGLSMVFGFIKQSGGHMNVYSELGVGTTFRLYLPRVKSEADTEVAAADAAVAQPVQSGNEIVLVVEDNPSVRETVVRQMQSLGYQTREAEDVPSAIASLEAEAVDLMFTDIVMPGSQNGLDLAWIARARWPRMAVLLTSGFPEDRVRDHNQRMAGFRLLSKPYRKAELAAAVREALDSIRSGKTEIS